MKSATLPKKVVATRKQASSSGAPSAHELVGVIHAGLPFREVEALRDRLGLPMDQVASKLGIPRATLHRRKLAGRLATDESDKVLRFGRLVAQATEVFGGIEEARQWLAFPQHGLGGAVPLDYAGTEVGAREVENLLGAIEYGVYY